MNLFTGDGKVSQLFPFPKVLSEEDISTMQMLIDPIGKVTDNLSELALKQDATEKIDDKLWQVLKDVGAFGLQVPVEYGGAGMNNTQYLYLASATGNLDLGVSVCLGAHQSIGFKGILLYGNDEQKQKYLPQLAAGDKLAAFCLTEPGAGAF
jgi:very long chain acyl-CoA dehydrogenase